METKAFGKMTFDSGWKANFEITLWDRPYPIIVKIKAFHEKDGITAAQEEACAVFKETISEKQKRIEALLAEHYKNFPLEADDDFIDGGFDLENFDPEKLWEDLTPRTLLVNEDGECALLFDQESYPDNGLAVILIPKEKEEVQTQDEYL